MDLILPEEVLLNVLRHASSIADIAAAAQTSRTFSRVAVDNNLWRQFCYRDFRHLERWSRYFSDYRELYRRKLRTNQNWRDGTFSRSLELRGTLKSLM
jgi:hypothetical protein